MLERAWSIAVIGTAATIMFLCLTGAAVRRMING